MSARVHVGEERADSFLCSICRHYYPKSEVKYLKRMGKFKVCKDCFKEEM